MFVFAQFDVLTGVFLAALALMIVILLRRSHRYLSRQKKDDAALVHMPRPQGEDRRHHLDAPPDVLRWEVQMHETARDLSAQLDSKMSALQALIAEADRAAARLEAAMAEPSDAPQRPDELRRQPGDQAAALKSPQAEAPPSASPARSSVRHRHEEVYTLADYGLDAAEIAGRTGSPIGEIELILGLRDKR